ncbi:MAG: hypothetical protein IPK59_06220 [Rhodospirillaceae bacterium]|nr:hypothetical protein [Rhodospirillaceae bacterium]
MAKRKLPPGVSYRGKTKDGQDKHQGKVRAKGYKLNMLFIGPESDLEAGEWVAQLRGDVKWMAPDDPAKADDDGEGGFDPKN